MTVPAVTKTMKVTWKCTPKKQRDSEWHQKRNRDRYKKANLNTALSNGQGCSAETSDHKRVYSSPENPNAFRSTISCKKWPPGHCLDIALHRRYARSDLLFSYRQQWKNKFNVCSQYSIHSWSCLTACLSATQYYENCPLGTDTPMHRPRVISLATLPPLQHPSGHSRGPPQPDVTLIPFVQTPSISLIRPLGQAWEGICCLT